MARSDASCMRIAAGGGKAESHGKAFDRERGSPRMFNAIAVQLQGPINGTQEPLKAERNGLVKGFLRLETQLARRRTQPDETDADRQRLKPPREAKLRRAAHQNGVRLARLKAKLAREERRLERNVRGVCAPSN